MMKKQYITPELEIVLFPKVMCANLQVSARVDKGDNTDTWL